MINTLKRRTLLGIAGAVSTGALARPAIAADKKLKIALSNSYIGNKWRIEMENVFKAALQMEPFKSQVEGSWFNSGNDVSKQSQQLTNLIAERVDAIIINAASPTGLNGKGNVIMVTGVAGTSVDEDRNKGADNVWTKNPGIKVVSRYTGMWDSSTAERNTAAVLNSLPQIDGIWCQGGTDGVLKAFIAANRPLPPTAGEAENGFRKFMTGYMGHMVDGISVGQPPYLSVVALELTRRILNKEYPRKDITIPFPYVTTATVKAGETVFSDLPDSFFDDFTDSGPDAVVTLCKEAALDGTPCAGTLKVNLPAA